MGLRQQGEKPAVGEKPAMTEKFALGETVADAGRAMFGLLRRNVRLVLVCLAATVVLWILEELGEGEIMKLDAMAQALLVDTLRADWLTAAMVAITNLAAPVTLVVTCLVAATFAPGRRPSTAMLANLAGAFLINQVLKFIVQRPRPEGFRLVEETGYSFPSGHSMLAMAFFGLIVYLVWHYEKNAVARWARCTFFSLLIVLIGVSRVYLGVHYASDVLAGFLISLAWLAVFTKVVCPVLLHEEPAGRASKDLPEDPSLLGRPIP